MKRYANVVTLQCTFTISATRLNVVHRLRLSRLTILVTSLCVTLRTVCGLNLIRDTHPAGRSPSYRFTLISRSVHSECQRLQIMETVVTKRKCSRWAQTQSLKQRQRSQIDIMFKFDVNEDVNEDTKVDIDVLSIDGVFNRLTHRTAM